MANSLINGASGDIAPQTVESDPNAGKVPTWGYGVDGAKLFHLDPGAALPTGYEDHPDKISDVAVDQEPAPRKKLKLPKEADGGDVQ